MPSAQRLQTSTKCSTGDRLAMRKERLDYLNKIAPVSLMVETSPGKFHAIGLPLGWIWSGSRRSKKNLPPSLAATRPFATCPGSCASRVRALEGRAVPVPDPLRRRVNRRRRRADYVPPDVLEQAIKKSARSSACGTSRSRARPPNRITPRSLRPRPSRRTQTSGATPWPRWRMLPITSRTPWKVRATPR